MRRQQRQLRDHFHPHHRHPRPPRRARPMTMMTIRIQSAHWHLGCCRTWRTQISVVIGRTRVPPLQEAGESASHLEMYLCIEKAGSTRAAHRHPRLGEADEVTDASNRSSHTEVSIEIASVDDVSSTDASLMSLRSAVWLRTCKRVCDEFMLMSIPCARTYGCVSPHARAMGSEGARAHPQFH